MNQQKSMALGYIIGGYGCLLGSAFLDNLRGPLIPIIAEKLDITYENASWFLAMGSIAAIISSFALIWLMGKFSERRVAIGLCLFASAGALLALSVSSFAILLVFAGVIGAGLISLNIIANVLTIRGTPLHLQPRVMGGLHAMYGTGSLLAPLAAGRLLAAGWSWKWMFLMPIPLFLLLIAVLRFSTKEEGPAPQDTKAGYRLKANHILLLVIFALYVAAEVLASSWMVTYLTETWNYDHVSASDNLSLFFSILMGTRVLCLLIDCGKYERQLLWGSLFCPFAIFIAAVSLGMPQLLPLLGLFGPFFPLMMARTAKVFPDMWRSLSAWVQVSIQLMLALSHYFIGYTATHYGASTAYLFPLLCLAAACAALFWFEKRTQPGEAPA